MNCCGNCIYYVAKDTSGEVSGEETKPHGDCHVDPPPTTASSRKMFVLPDRVACRFFSESEPK